VYEKEAVQHAKRIFLFFAPIAVAVVSGIYSSKGKLEDLNKSTDMLTLRYNDLSSKHDLLTKKYDDLELKTTTDLKQLNDSMYFVQELAEELSYVVANLSAQTSNLSIFELREGIQNLSDISKQLNDSLRKATNEMHCLEDRLSDVNQTMEYVIKSNETVFKSMEEWANNTKMDTLNELVARTNQTVEALQSALDKINDTMNSKRILFTIETILLFCGNPNPWGAPITPKGPFGFNTKRDSDYQYPVSPPANAAKMIGVWWSLYSGNYLYFDNFLLAKTDDTHVLIHGHSVTDQIQGIAILMSVLWEL